jgi:signal transduction histidine kinase/CheY-like chemotaxis protein
MAEPGGKPARRPGSRRGLRLHYVLFLVIALVAACPVALLAIWENHATYRNELDSVRERHLLVARNLTSTMSRYVQDVRAAFATVFESDAFVNPVPGLPRLLNTLHIEQVMIIGADNTVGPNLAGLDNDIAPNFDAKLLDTLRQLTPRVPGQPALSNLVKNRRGHPVLLIVQPLSGGRLGVGVLMTTYLVSLQQAIAFGDNGHAVITDAAGQVIGHPFKDWIAASRDISGVSVVAAMKRGETGVGMFYSPAFKGDMIAGYSFVPETGWGVMVPQPIVELQRRAGQINEMATIVALASFAGAAIISFLLAFYLTRPVRVVATTAEAVLAGNEEVAVPEFSGWVPREIRRLRQAFNTMLDGLRRKAAETAQALRQAEASNQAKSQFLANMSHEIRTPLNGVVGMIELMRLTDLTVTQRRYTEQATQSSQTLLRLVDDILDLSRIEAGRLELESIPFHLPSLMHDARMLVAEQAREKGLRLGVVVPDDMNVVLLGDPHRLLQVLTNLLGNAVKFTPEGDITARVSRIPADSTSWLLRFEVTDTGIGVPASRIDAIFEPFTQADNSTTRRYGGTGLGLSIAREIVRMMGGEIGVDSTVGQGSTFWFTVALEPSAQIPAALSPVSAQPPAARAVEAPTPTTTAAGFKETLARHGRESIRVLLVEDNPANMRVTRALVETLGCEVVGARNGLEAVAAYRASRFDVVLMDCQMPEMDGYEAARAIRQIETIAGKTTPIIALTAHAMAGSRQASLDAGMNDQLTKPLTMAALTDMLLLWLTSDARTG